MIRMPKTVLLLLGVILYLCVALVRVERQRYALWMGLCHSPFIEVRRNVSPSSRTSKRRCNVSATQTRGPMRSGTSGTRSSIPSLPLGASGRVGPDTRPRGARQPASNLPHRSRRGARRSRRDDSAPRGVRRPSAGAMRDIFLFIRSAEKEDDASRQGVSASLAVLSQAYHAP